MFTDMDKAFSIVPFEFQNDRDYLVARFLTRFHAIFTLNQDLLLERHYLNDNVSLLSNPRWNGYEVPGMKRISDPAGPLDTPNLGRWAQDPGHFSVSPGFQPFFKLHGSSNWIAPGSDALLVIGGNKRSIIDRYPVLRQYHEQFRAYLSKPDTRLMVIGYGFGDEHINEAIREAVAAHNLKLFVIDPLGADVMDQNRRAQIPDPHSLANDIGPSVVGLSRRSLREIFGSDRAEHAKVMRFFS